MSCLHQASRTGHAGYPAERRKVRVDFDRSQAKGPPAPSSTSPGRFPDIEVG